MRTILAGLVLVGLALCSAVASAAVAAEPSPELIATGKALVEAGDCGGCHTADPAKPFACGKRIDSPDSNLLRGMILPRAMPAMSGMIASISVTWCFFRKSSMSCMIFLSVL